MDLRFNDLDFAWRHDLDETVVVYRFGGKSVFVLSGDARRRFLDVVGGGGAPADARPGLARLVAAGVFIPVEAS